MITMQSKLQIFSANTWLFPGTSDGQSHINLSTARGSYACCQMLLHTSDNNAPFQLSVSCSQGLPRPSCFEILPVCVNRNSCFIEDLDTQRTPLHKLENYYTKRAPFWVYDALKPIDEIVICQGTETALYLKWYIPSETEPGVYRGTVTLKNKRETISVPYEIEIFHAEVPKIGEFQMINWIAPSAVHYGFEQFSSKHWNVLKELNKLACEARQTHVNVNASFFYFRTENGKIVFQFDRAKKYIQMCMELGCRFIEGPSLKELYFATSPNASEDELCSPSCLEFLSAFLEQWYTFLQENNYTAITVQHIFDEPRDKNVHLYKELGNLVKEKMPNIPTLDAVLTTQLANTPDIIIPTTRFYQLHKSEFDDLAQNGRKLWLYTCCWPSAPYLNRFLDMPLLSVRYIHWLCYLLKVPAYLHWGFCFQADSQDAFTESSIPFKIFDDSLEQYLPPGDTNIVYPVDGIPVGSVRLEMQRAGIEDFELLSQLSHETGSALAKHCVHSDFTADTDLSVFERQYRALLTALNP